MSSTSPCKVILNSLPTGDALQCALAIYRERYQAFRHLDSLRWRLPTLAIGFGGSLLAFAGREQRFPRAWAVVFFGIMMLLTSFIMHRVILALDSNRTVLNDIGRQIGDHGIPRSGGWAGASRVTCVVLLAAGLLSIIWGLLGLPGVWS